MTVPVKVSPQAKLVLDYLKSGRTLTALIAITNLGVGSVTTRIAELRKAGVVIEDRWDQDHFERRFKKWWMESSRSQGGFGEAEG